MVSLCFYFQQLLHNEEIYWLQYDASFEIHLNEWSNKCKNKINDYETQLKIISQSDIIMYQEIVCNKSSISNFLFLNAHKKGDCKLFTIPSIYFDYNNFNESLNELREREYCNKTIISVSSLIEKYKDKKLMLTKNHPNTFLFLKIIKNLCLILNINFFSEDKYEYFMSNDNFMNLP
jgi:hypothetical protein